MEKTSKRIGVSQVFDVNKAMSVTIHGIFKGHRASDDPVDLTGPWYWKNRCGPPKGSDPFTDGIRFIEPMTIFWAGPHPLRGMDFLKCQYFGNHIRPRLPRETRSLFHRGRPDIVCVGRASAASGRPLIKPDFLHEKLAADIESGDRPYHC